MRDQSWYQQLRWVDFVNNAGEEIPAFGVIKISGVDSDGFLTAVKPNQHGSQWQPINGPIAVANNAKGQCTYDTPYYVKYDTADTPAAGELWGPDSSFEAKSSAGGFRIIGDWANSRVLVARHPQTHVMAELTANISAGGSGNAKELRLDGTWQTFGDNFTVYDVMSATFVSGDRVWCWWEEDAERWLIMQADC